MSRIVVLSYDYPPNDGGISRLVSGAVDELARRGQELEVLTLESGGRTGPDRPAVAAREVTRTGMRRDLDTFSYLKNLPTDHRILATVWNPEATLAWLAGRSNITVMAHGNEVMPYPRGLKWAVKDRLRRKVLTAASTVVCNSRYTERLVQSLVPSTRTVIICPAVDAERFSVSFDAVKARDELGLPPDKRLILSVSRLDAYKGHDVVLHALARLPPEVKRQLHYAIAGRGSHLNALQKLAADLGVDDSITWLGFVNDEILPRLYGCADLFVLCTREDPHARGVEGFGMVFLEAQAAGVATLGTAAGGIPDAITPGEGGWLVAQDDVEAVVAHLNGLVDDPLRYRQQGALGRARVQRDGTWKMYVDRLLAAMEKNDV